MLHKDVWQSESWQPLSMAEEVHTQKESQVWKKNYPLEPWYVGHKYQESYKRNMYKKAKIS